MAVDRNDAAKTQESATEARLEATPAHATKRERERRGEVALRLGKRTYPVWTRAMVEAREKLKALGFPSLSEAHERDAIKRGVGARGLIPLPAKA